jgi:hypothetical protein
VFNTPIDVPNTDRAVSRRDWLKIGGLGGLGLGPPALLGAPRAGASAATPATTFGRAKSCILLFLFGSPPQHETFDPKPLAPAEIQGELQSTATSLPGVEFCEDLPRTAQVADRLTIVRSMSHPYPLHGVAYALTGLPVYTTDLEVKPRDPAHWPYFGSIADYFWSQQSKTGEAEIPRHIGLPWVFNSQVDDLGLIAGPYATFLGQAYDPTWAKFDGSGLAVAPKCRHEQPKEYVDPYLGIGPEGKFVFDGAARFPEQVSRNRFEYRRSLLQQLETAEGRADVATAVQSYSDQQARAFSLLTSTKVRDALDVTREGQRTRAEYGMTLFGQSCLAARRLVEAGTRFISVFWDAFGTYFSGAWDTHQNHYPRLKRYLLPGFDAAYAALIADLEQRGLLDETLVLLMSEHGRTPQIDSKPKGAARHHWSQAYSMALAGGGSRRGAVVGRTDRIGGTVLDTPISPKDIQATAFHLLGIDSHALMRDRFDRPFPIAGDGGVRPELLG